MTAGSSPSVAHATLVAQIERAFEDRLALTPETAPAELHDALMDVLAGLDDGRLRVAEKIEDDWVTHTWIKQALLLCFRVFAVQTSTVGDLCFHDRFATKFQGWDAAAFQRRRIRVAPPAVARFGSYIAPGAILMPSYINLGAHVGEDTMVDTWATIGSCAQVGARVHISGGAGVGGVLEPLQARPTIIEDDCFIGARSEIVEGVIVGAGSVVSMGVFIGASTKIFDRASGAISYGRIPPGSVVVPGSLPAADGSHSVGAAIIVKTVDAETRRKVAINELVRFD